MTHAGRLYRAAIDEEMARLRMDLGAGAAKDYSEYRYFVGVLEGLIDAKKLMDDVDERL